MELPGLIDCTSIAVAVVGLLRCSTADMGLAMAGLVKAGTVVATGVQVETDLAWPHIFVQANLVLV